jgi:hypothetical protein
VLVIRSKTWRTAGEPEWGIPLSNVLKCQYEAMNTSLGLMKVSGATIPPMLDRYHLDQDLVPVFFGLEGCSGWLKSLPSPHNWLIQLLSHVGWHWYHDNDGVS